MLISENPYYVPEGHLVKLKCQLHEIKGFDDIITVGIRKKTHGGVFETVSFIEYNKSSRGIVSDNGDVTLDKDIFIFSINGTVEASGFYRCFCQRFPNLRHSGKTEVVVQGK